jgi:hypothetical protein
MGFLDRSWLRPVEIAAVAVFLAYFLFLSLSSYGWGYDEYGAVVTHLELDDPRFLDEYKARLLNFGLNDWVIRNLCIPLVSVFIVPLRWTYALGISPLYAIARLEGLDWYSLRALLTLMHGLAVVVGLKFLLHSLASSAERTLFFLVCLALVLASHPFMYWMSTFTSYSLHTLCFGLIVFTEKKKESWENRIFGRASLFRGIVALSNYQYLPLLFILGCKDLFVRRWSFFSKGVYKNWCIPGVVSCVSVIFISVRLKMLDSGISPELNFSNASRYLIPYADTIDTPIDFLEFFVSRLADIFFYFFLSQDRSEYFLSSSFSQLSFIVSVAFLGFCFIVWFKIKGMHGLLEKGFRNILFVSLILIGIQCILYLSNVLPASPSRHSFIIFWPLVSIVATVIVGLINVSKIQNFLMPGLVFFASAILFSFTKFDRVRTQSVSTPVISCMEEVGINVVILENCFLEPVVQNKNKEFVYSCGSFIPESVPKDVRNLGLLATHQLMDKDAKLLISRYSEFSWKRDLKRESELSQCTSRAEVKPNEKLTNSQVYVLGG